MSLESLRGVVTSRPGWVVALWIADRGCGGPLCSRLDEARGRGSGRSTGERCARVSVRPRRCAIAWPDQTYESLAVAALHRAGGLTANDIGYAKRLVERIEAPGRPNAVLRALGPGSKPEVASRLLSKDGTVALVAVPLSTSFVAPATHEAVAWLQSQARADRLDLSEGLEVRWAGDALIGRDYMSNVQTSLDRAAVATVVLLLGVLFAVYRSVWLALVPLATIGISLVICSECSGMDDPGRMGGLAARRVVPGRPPLRMRD